MFRYSRVVHIRYWAFNMLFPFLALGLNYGMTRSLRERTGDHFTTDGTLYNGMITLCFGTRLG